MAGELALSSILRNDAVIQSYCGNNPVRVYLNKRPQVKGLPAITLRRIGTAPNGTKDGASQLDATRVQVLIYDDDLTANTFKLEQRVRELLDRPAVSGVVNDVNLESSSFEDDDCFNEQLVDKEVNVIEHIYKTLIKR